MIPFLKGDCTKKRCVPFVMRGVGGGGGGGGGQAFSDRSNLPRGSIC